MKNVVAVTQSVALLQVAYEALSTRDIGIPGMALVYGLTGTGKTTAIARLINTCDGVYVRATSGWTPASMLAKVMAELGATPMQRRSDMLDWIVERLRETQRPLFVDEADYLLGTGSSKPMLESLRDIHDLAGTPVVLVGMGGGTRGGIEKRLQVNPQLSRRISQWVEFTPLTLVDARAVATATCEVRLDDELLGLLHEAARGQVGNIVVGLARIEALAKGNGWREVSAAQWGDRPLFLGNRPAGA